MVQICNFNLFSIEKPDIREDLHFYIIELLPECLKKAFKYIMRIEPTQKIDYEDLKSHLYDYEGSPISKQCKISNFNKLNPIKLRSMSSDVD